VPSLIILFHSIHSIALSPDPTLLQKGNKQYNQTRQGVFAMLMDTQRKNEQERVLDEHNKIGAGIGFERTRRITGYLVGTLDRFNNAKQAEERDRVKHSV
jgi:hypothetical protein